MAKGKQETKATTKGKGSTATAPKGAKAKASEVVVVEAKESNIIANKTSIIAETAKTLELSVADVTGVVNTFLDAMQVHVIALQPDQKVKIGGLGTFEVREGNPRMGRNPDTGADVEVPAKLRPKFTIESGLKKAATTVL
jgi:nucleoid DNA-binding protein